MTTTEVRHGDDGRERIRTELLISRARSAARAGEREEALRLLSSVPEPQPRAVLDLLARLHAQQGNLKQAAAHWHEVRQRHPQDAEAAAGLARIERLQRRGAVGALSRHRTVVAAVCAAAVAGLVALPVLAGDDAAPGPPAHAGTTSLFDQLRDQQRAAQQATEDRAASMQQAAQSRQRLEDLARSLRAPGTQAEVHEEGVDVIFTEALFSRADHLTPGGELRLVRLGKALTGQEVRMTVYGHAATVGDAPDRGGSVTSLWRALIAARELSQSSGRPLTAFTTKSADQRDAPHRTAAGNRTVTITVQLRNAAKGGS